LAYLPFFIVRGFADRFANASSAAVAIVLSAGVWAVYERSRQIGIAVLLGLVCFYALAMQNRITIWQEAGNSPAESFRTLKLPNQSCLAAQPWCPLDIPDMYKHALVFTTGLDRAVRL
jgi:hypothetical protein